MIQRPLIGPVEPPDLHVMTFNIRRAMDGSLRRRRDRWSVRAPAVAGLLRSEHPTVVGLQEVRPRAVDVVRESLGPTHRLLGRGRRRDGTGEGNPLAYDDARLELHEWGQQALSDRPDAPGSRTWGNLLPRTLVWAEFSDRSTAARFLVVNTHLDHLSPRSRRRSAEAVVALVQRRSLPAVVMGDLNAGADAASVRALLAPGRLGDAWDRAESRLTPAWGTFPGYRAPRRGGLRIDRLLVSPGVQVRTAAINARTIDGVRPSDHLPVQGALRIDEGAR